MKSYMPYILVALISGTIFAGCSLAPVYKRPEMKVPENLSTGIKQYKKDGVNVCLNKIGWKNFFDDQLLKELINLALLNNHNLKTIAFTVEEFQAIYRIERSQLFPDLFSQGNYIRQKTMGKKPYPITKNFSASVGVSSYELDFFGRVRNLREVALERYLAMDSSLKSASISLISQIAETYFRFMADQELVSISMETLAMEKSSYDLMNKRFQSGITNELELVQAKSSLENARFNLAMYKRLLVQDQNALRYLVGHSLPEVSGGEWSKVKGLRLFLSNPLPSRILLQRPDIIAAEHDMKASHASVGAARAAFFPSIALTASAGFMSDAFSNLFEASSKTWLFSPGIKFPIFTGGRLKGQLDAAKIRKESSINNYEHAIERAFREVADALAGQDGYDKQLDAQIALLNASNRYYDLAKIRYDEGLDSFLTLLDAQRLLFRTKQATVNLELARLLNEIALYKALGGGDV